MLRAIRLAWISSVRQPARTGLGVLGIAAVGALLFDMLLLSRGLVISFRDVLDRTGFDIRILATESPVRSGPRIAGAGAVAKSIASLPVVQSVVPVSFLDAEIVERDAGPAFPQGNELQFIGSDPAAAPFWTLLEGEELSTTATPAPIIVNRALATAYDLVLGSSISLRGDCGEKSRALPAVSFTVAGIAEFPLDDADSWTAAGRQPDLDAVCGRQDDSVDMVLVRSIAGDGGDEAAAAIRAANPGLYVVTNEELVEQFSRVQFSYFRQISFVLATVTLFFGFLLIAVLLTASVNQRFAEIAALRALGLSRGRVVSGVLAESAIMVGIGAVLAVPAGFVLSTWLDEILRSLPGIPSDVHFFVFEPRVLVWYSALLLASSVGAALYPIWLVARLPVAATLRREVTG